MNLHDRVAPCRHAVPWACHFVILHRTDHASVYLTREARKALAKLDPSRREALSDGFGRVGLELLSSAEQVTVEVGWARRTWPRRRYRQQCYAKTVKFVFDHPEIMGMRLIHGVVSHASHLVPFDHAWVELPGDIISMASCRGSSGMTVTTASWLLSTWTRTPAPRQQAWLPSTDTRAPWNAKWVPTPTQVESYVTAVRAGQDGSGATVVSLNVGKNR
jgi:hypothetical protein